MRIEKTVLQEKEKEYNPNKRLNSEIYLVLETQGDVDKIYSIFNWAPLLNALYIDNLENFYREFNDAESIRDKLRDHIDHNATQRYFSKLTRI